MSDCKGSHCERDIILWEGPSSEKQHREGIQKIKISAAWWKSRSC